MFNGNEPGPPLILTLVLVLMFLLGGTCSRLYGQDERGVLVEVPPDLRRNQGFDAADSTALFVGVSAFRDPKLASVPYAVDDAVDLAYLFAVDLKLVDESRLALAISGEPVKPESRKRLEDLKTAGAQVSSASRSDIRRMLSRQSRGAGETGLFLVGFATHGFTHRGEDFLFAWDTYLDDPKEDGVPIRWLFDYLANAGTERRFALIDACRERLGKPDGRGVGDSSPMGQAFHNAITSAEGQVVLAATTTDGYAYDDPKRKNGVFTAAVLDGLKGAAEKDKGLFVTAGTLADYVDQRVDKWLREHAPPPKGVMSGITRNIEGLGAALPLAVDPVALERSREYKERRTLALDWLRENLRGLLTRSTFECVKRYLDVQLPTDARNALLAEISSLDGTPYFRWRFAAYLRKDVIECKDSVPNPLTTCKRHEDADWLSGGQPVNAHDCYLAVLEVDPVNYEAIEGVARICETYLSRASVSFEGGEVKKAKYHLKQAKNVCPEHSKVKWLEESINLCETYLRGTREAIKRGDKKGAEMHLEGAEDVCPHHADVKRLRDKVRELSPLPTEPPRNPRAGEIWKSPIIKMEFVWVPDGCFQMGSAEGPDREHPVHKVCVKGFWLGRHEVTQRQWKRSMDVNPSGFQRGLHHPVERVSWSDAQEFIARFNEIFGPGFRLPSESEWEYACRSGRTDETYCGEKDPEQIAWFGGNAEGRTHPVGSKQGNRWKLLDMSGNVSEWVQDCYHDSYRDAPNDGSAREEEACTHRLIRGGSWDNYAGSLRAAWRRKVKPDFADDTIGFRLARSP